MNIYCYCIDEGSFSCVMSLSCWKDLGSLTLVPSRTLLQAFDGHSMKPNGSILSFPNEFGGKTVFIEVEVVYYPLDYILLLG